MNTNKGFLVLSEELMIRVYKVKGQKVAVCLLDDGRAVVFEDQPDGTCAFFRTEIVALLARFRSIGALPLNVTAKQRKQLDSLLTKVYDMRKKNAEIYESMFESLIGMPISKARSLKVA